MLTATINNKIINQAEIQNISVSGDAIDTIRFIIQKTYNEIDLSTGVFKGVYELKDGSGGEDDVVVTHSDDETELYVDWLLKDGVVSRSGKVSLQVVSIMTNHIWQSKPVGIYVTKSLNPTIGDFSPSGMVYYLQVFEGLLAETKGYRDEALGAVDSILNDAGFIAVFDDLPVINQVADDTVPINQVASDTIPLNTVALKLIEIQTVSDNIASINTVAGIQAAVSALALISADITA